MNSLHGSLYCLFILLVSGPALAATRYVGTCGTPNTTTIAAAVTAASAGDEILICPGTYNEAVTVSKNNLTIRGSTGARGDVTVSSSGIPFTLSAASPTLKDMTITSSNDRGISRDWTASPSTATFSNLAVSAKGYGIYVDVSTKVTMTNLNVSSSNSNAIHLAWATNGAHEFDTITATASSGQAIHTEQGGAVFRNLTLSSKNEAIYAAPASNAVFDTVTATSSNDAGINLIWTSPASTLDFRSVTVSARSRGIYINKSGKATFNNVNVTSSNSDAIYLESGVSGAHEFRSLTLKAKDYGLYTYRGGTVFNNLDVTSSSSDGILMYSEYDSSFENVKVSATQGHGIYMGWATYYKKMTFKNIEIAAKNMALYINNSDVVTIDGMTAASSSNDAVYFSSSASGAHSLNNMTLNAKESGVKFESAVWSTTMRGICTNSGKYGVWISQWDSRNVSILDSKLTATTYGIRTDANPSYKTRASGNCVMKSSSPRAYSNNTSHKFDGNYWQGVASGAAYSDGNVRDNSPLAACPVSSCFVQSTVDHYEVAVPSSNLACLTSPVTIKACADATSPCTNVATTVNGTASLTTSAGTLGSTSLTFSNGVATTTLGYPGATNGGTATLTLSSESIAATNVRTCCIGASCSVSNTCSATFNTAGFIFATAKDESTQSIDNQTAGMASAVHYLRAVKTNTTTKACEAALTGSNAVKLGYACGNPATCTSGSYMSITPYNDSTAKTAVALPSGGGDVTLYFDANGNAPLAFNYLDAGNINLTASKTASGSLLSALSGSSNAFVVKPYGFKLSGFTCATADKTSTAAGAFCVAGGTFTATAEPVRFDSTATNNLGTATPNFGRESPTPQTVTLAPAALVLPTTAVGGTLTDFTTSTTGSFDATTHQATATMVWPNVGTITIQPTMDYLGAGDLTSGGTTDSTAYAGGVGRFYPSYFALGSASVTAACTTGGFSYMADAHLGLQFTVTAHKKGGGKTSNYLAAATGGYPVGTVSVIAENANAGTNLGGRLSGLGSPTWVAGDYAVNTTMASFSRSTAVDGPYETLQVGAQVTDNDAVLTGLNMNATTTDDCTAGATPNCDAAKVGNPTKVRFGRLRLSNAFGSDKLNLSVPVQAQYWSGSSWVINADDSCTSFASGAVNLTGALSTDNKASGDVTLAGGNGNIVLHCPYANCPPASKPASALTGTVGVCVDLGTDPGTGTACTATSPAPGLAHLKGLWPPGTAYDNDPAARATFGVYAPETRKAVHVREEY